MIAFPKPAKGSYRAEKLATRAHLDYVETTAKAAAKRRDGHRCRRPGCSTNLRLWRLEAAHLDDKGMGGDHGLRSAVPADYVSLCVTCHCGPAGLHAKRLRAVPITPNGGDGLIQWFRLSRDGEWIEIGVN